MSPSRTIFEEKIGGATLRIVSVSGGFRGAIIRKGAVSQIIEDTDSKRLESRLRNKAGKLHPDYFGMEGAIKRFRTYFPEGFESPRYREMERNYKDRARSHLL